MRMLIILVFSVLSVMAAPVNAYLSTNRIIDETHILDLKTHDNLATMLSRAAKDQEVDITIVLVNDDTVFDHSALAKQIVMAREARLKNTKSEKKRVYLIVNASSNQAAIALGTATDLDAMLQESLMEIQQKILAPHLQKNELDAAVRLAAMAMVSALEDWPGMTLSRSSSFYDQLLISGLKWFAELGLIIALLMLLRILFHRPHWQELPIAEEAHFLENQQQSAEMAYWRAHRHIKSFNILKDNVIIR